MSDLSIDEAMSMAVDCLVADDVVERSAALIAVALLHNARAVRYAAYTLGTADAATQMGALEAVAASIKEGCEALSSAIYSLERQP